MVKLRVASIVKESIVDGPGLRYVIFTQGCPHHCIGCHNPSTHDTHLGEMVDLSTIIEEIDKNPLLDGITLSGGEPFLQVTPVLTLVKQLKKSQKHIIVYTGYLFEELLTMGEDVIELLRNIDILIDGAFDIEKRSLSLLWRGSSNQRIIDVQSSLKENQVITSYLE